MAAALADIRDDTGDAERNAAPRLSVFVHLSPDASEADRAVLVGLGVPPAAARSGIATATLSPQAIDELSEKPWVRQLRLSQRLRLLGEEAGPTTH